MEIVKNIIVPIIALAIAIISLFTDTKKTKGLKGLLRNRLSLMLIFLIFASTISIILTSIQETQDAENSEVKMDEIDTKTSKIYDLLKANLYSFGVKDPDNLSLGQIKEISMANDNRQYIIKHSTNLSRKQIIIRYFQKDVDSNKVINALSELDFQLSKGKAKIPNGETNAIYYGNKVDAESIKLVALTLFRAGVQLKEIIPFISSEGREYEIQVVHSDELKSNDNLDVKSINNFSK